MKKICVICLAVVFSFCSCVNTREITLHRALFANGGRYLGYV